MSMASSFLSSPISLRDLRRGTVVVSIPRRSVKVNAKEGRRKVKYAGTKARERHLEEMIEKTVAEAKEVCEGDEASDECRVAWDQVEEVSRAKADLRRRIDESDHDPLEAFCMENPDTHECRVYDD